ncbi:MAG: sulfite exporter TauE/SafE family protein [Firmicutes bacterium]|nr:sulfite exporter TauE/SafE family protein [Bacillota bacterium]
MFVIILGLLSGVLAGLAVGGGTLLVPGLVLIQGTPQHVAQGISLFIFLPTSVLAILTHLRYGNVQWKLAAQLAVGAVIGSFLGAQLALLLQPKLLRKIFAVYLLAMAIYQLLASPKQKDAR